MPSPDDSRSAAPPEGVEREMHGGSMPDPFVVLVCGSRDWGDYEAIERRLGLIPCQPRRLILRHGASSRKLRGVEQSADTLAAIAAATLHFEIQAFPADWDRYGRSAGFRRNVEMLEAQPVPGLVLAFQRNNSRGTQHTIDEARRRGIPVEVHHA